MNYDHFQLAWSRLRQHTEPFKHGELMVASSGSSIEEGAILLGVDESGLPHVLFPLKSDALDFADRRSAGVHLVVRDLEHDGQLCRYLDLSARREHLARVFGYLAEEAFVSALSTGDSMGACRGALSRWRELIDRDVPGILSGEALRGLFGELWVLRLGLALDYGFASAWRGYSGHPHDFFRHDAALEVKTTLFLDKWSFRIHGLAQLEAPESADLFLVALRLIPDDVAGESITTIVQEILSTGIDRVAFMTALAKIGYRQSDEIHYAAMKFVVAAERTWRVSNDFPRLIQQDFGGGTTPAGVSDIHYTIDVPNGFSRVEIEHALKRMRA